MEIVNRGERKGNRQKKETRLGNASKKIRIAQIDRRTNETIVSREKEKVNFGACKRNLGKIKKKIRIG